MANHEFAVECRNLSKVYDDAGKPVRVLRQVNLQLRPGEAVAIVGVSGAGKSTLLHLLGGLDQPSAGEVLIQGQSLGQMGDRQICRLRNRVLGFVYQFHHLLPEFSAVENVAMPLLIGRLAKPEAKARAARLLEDFGLAERCDHRPAELSGGERQRVAIARAMVNDPLCLLADEPTGNLDSRTAGQVFDALLSNARNRQTALLVVTHDRELARRADRTLELDGGLRESGQPVFTSLA